MNNKTGLVLIHGAGLGNYIWDELTPLLNYPVLMVELPNRFNSSKSNKGLLFDDYTKAAITQIKNWKTDSIVLVTHSIGGCLGLKIMRSFTNRITGFVGISAAIPLNGKSFLSCLPFPQSIIMPLILNLFGTKPPSKTIEADLCNGLTPEQTLKVVERFTPEARSIYTTKIDYEPFKISSLYIKLELDKAFPPQLQDKMISNLQAKHTLTINCGHLPMLSNPNELGQILNNFTLQLQ